MSEQWAISVLRRSLDENLINELPVQIGKKFIDILDARKIAREFRVFCVDRFTTYEFVVYLSDIGFYRRNGALVYDPASLETDEEFIDKLPKPEPTLIEIFGRDVLIRAFVEIAKEKKQKRESKQ